MRIEPLLFKDFETGQAGAAARGKSYLPGGRRREEAPPPPPAPTFSEDELKAAERESYKKGFLEGTQEGKSQAESEQAATARQLAQTAEQFMNSLAPLLNDYRQMIHQLRADMPKVALAIAKKVAGDALNANAQSVIDAMAQACAEAMIGEPKISIAVHPSLAAALELKLQELSARLHTASHFTVTRNETLAVSDCRIEWKHGAMERHTGELWAQVEKVVEGMVASAVRETDEQINKLTPSPSGEEGA